MRTIALIFLVLGADLGAETLLMINGAVVRGRILAQDRTTVTIETQAGPQVIQKAQIRRIVFDDAKFDEEQKRLEQERLKLEQQRQEQLRLEQMKQEQLKQEQARLEEEEKRQAVPETPGIEKRGFILGAGLWTNDYVSGPIQYLQEDRINPLNIFNLSVDMRSIRSKGYGSFATHFGYQGSRWYFVADAGQLYGHSRFEEVGYGLAFLQGPSTSHRAMFGEGIAQLQRDSLSGRLAVTPVPADWSFRPYLYAGYGRTKASARIDYNSLNPGFTAPPTVSLISGRMLTYVAGMGPETGIDLRYVRENGFEVRATYGQAWHSGEIRTTGDIIAVRLGQVTSLMDNLWLKPKIVGEASLQVQKYGFTIYTPRVRAGRLFFSWKSERSNISVRNQIPDYLPITELSLMQNGIGGVAIDFALKQATQRHRDRFAGVGIGWESVL